MSPSMEARIAEYAAAPTPPSPLSPWSSLLPQIPSPPLPPPPSSLHLPPPVPTSLPLPLSPLPPLPASLSIPPPVDHKEELPRLSYHLIRGYVQLLPHRDADIRRQRAEEVGYGIRDVWVDLTDVVEEVAPTTLEGVNARVTKLTAVQEQDTQDIYAVVEDGLDRQTQLFQRVDGLVEDGQLSSAVHYELQAYRTHTQMQDYRIASQESLMTTLIAQVSSLHKQLSAALGQIQVLQARDQTHADDHEGAGSSA
ncbi:hypothetical protein Tco_1196156 [Tanacetum coccineum]